MKQPFDFDSIGKRMPYTVPEGFFSSLQENVWKEAAPQRSPASRHRSFAPLRVAAFAAAVAAAATLAVVFLRPAAPAASERLAAIEQAFSALTPEEQAFLLETYQEDPFINEQP